MNTDTSSTPSPCIGKCGLNAQDICKGCFRSMSEILGWEKMDEAEKRSTVLKCKARRQARATRL